MMMIDGRRAAAFLWTGGDAYVPLFIACWVRAVTEQLLRERLDCRGHKCDVSSITAQTVKGFYK